MWERSLEIAKVNGRHNLLPHFLLALGFCLAAPLIMGVRNLDEVQVAKVVDMYVGFVGLILLVPLFMPDGNRDIRDLLTSKKTALTEVRLIRLMQAWLAVLLLLLLFLLGLAGGGCKFCFSRCLLAAVADCAALGGLGIFAYGITDQLVAGYLLPLIYYLSSLGAGKKYMGVLWLFGFSGSGELLDAGDKWYLLAAGIALTAAALLFRQWRRM